MSTPEQLRARILRNCEREPGGCWHWIGRKNANGYPRMTVRVNGYPVPLYSHRVALEVFRLGRRIKPGYQADHICNNPACVNPEHLQEVTH